VLTSQPHCREDLHEAFVVDGDSDCHLYALIQVTDVRKCLSLKLLIASMLRAFKFASRKLVELQPKGFDAERTLQKIIEKNMPVLFGGLELLTTEFPISNSRLDTVAFDRNKNTFVIIEYKNVKNK